MLRDVYCVACESVVEDVDMPMGAVTARTWCAVCQCDTDHAIVCNGGVGTRYRHLDWPTDPEFYRGQVKALDVTAKDSNGEDVRRYHSGTREHGEPMHAKDRYHNGTDAREERRDRIVSRGRRARGRTPLLFDMRGKRIKNGN